MSGPGLELRTSWLHCLCIECRLYFGFWVWNVYQELVLHFCFFFPSENSFSSLTIKITCSLQKHWSSTKKKKRMLFFSKNHLKCWDNHSSHFDEHYSGHLYIFKYIWFYTNGIIFHAVLRPDTFSFLNS